MVPQISQIKLGLFFIQLLIVSWTEIVNSQVIGSANDTIVFAFWCRPCPFIQIYLNHILILSRLYPDFILIFEKM